MENTLCSNVKCWWNWIWSVGENTSMLIVCKKNYLNSKWKLNLSWTVKNDAPKATDTCFWKEGGKHGMNKNKIYWIIINLLNVSVGQWIMIATTQQFCNLIKPQTNDRMLFKWDKWLKKTRLLKCQCIYWWLWLFSVECKSLVPWSPKRCHNFDERKKNATLFMYTNVFFSCNIQSISLKTSSKFNFVSKLGERLNKIEKKKLVVYGRNKRCFLCYSIRHSPWKSGINVDRDTCGKKKNAKK